MKKQGLILLLLPLLFSACGKRQTDDKLNVSPSQLSGLWAKESNPYEYWRFGDDGRGITWDETPDEDGNPEMTEEESNLAYSWYIEDGDVLRFSWTGAIGNQNVPKYYYIKAISSASMQWADDYGLSYTLNKVNAR